MKHFEAFLLRVTLHFIFQSLWSLGVKVIMCHNYTLKTTLYIEHSLSPDYFGISWFLPAAPTCKNTLFTKVLSVIFAVIPVCPKGVFKV